MSHAEMCGQYRTLDQMTYQTVTGMPGAAVEYSMYREPAIDLQYPLCFLIIPKIEHLCELVIIRSYENITEQATLALNQRNK